MKAATAGSMGALLRHMLRGPEVDRHLPDLSAHAILPSVRSVALRTLIEGRASWPEGYERKWIDKSHGLSRRVTRFGERALPDAPSPGPLIAQGARDRSPVVRRVAASGLIRHRDSLGNVADIIQLLALDSSRAVRERIEFLRHSQ